MQLILLVIRWPLFLGRNVLKLAAWAERLDSALAGEFALVLVEGEVGIGKSRLLDQFGSTLDWSKSWPLGMFRRWSSTSRICLLPPGLGRVLEGLDLETKDLPGVQVESFRSLAPLGRRAGFGEIDALEAAVEVIRPGWTAGAHLRRPSPGRPRHRRGTRVPAPSLRRISGDDPRGDARRRDASRSLASRLADTARIRLEPLTEHELGPLGIPDVHGRTGGHPTLVASLIASGSDPDLRGSLSELFIARCRAEGAVAFRVLMTASTLPEPFEPEVLAGLLETDPVVLVERLEQLARSSDPRVDGLRFRFRYAIQRDALRAGAVAGSRSAAARARAERPAASRDRPCRRSRSTSARRPRRGADRCWGLRTAWCSLDELFEDSNDGGVHHRSR